MMKNIYTLIALLFTIGLCAQTQKETVNQSFEVKGEHENFWFCLCNINGSIEAEAYDGNTIEMELEKVLFERGSDKDAKVENLSFDVVEGSDYTKIVMNFPAMTQGYDEDALSCNNWNWSSKDAGKDYNYEFNYKLRIPRNVNVKFATINNGHVEIKNIQGEIYVSNVNGDVSVREVAGNLKASTVNGTLDISYNSMDADFGEFNTVNGTIYVFVPDNGKGVFNFDTRWGEVFSEFEFDEKMAPKLKTERDGSKTRYKMVNSNGYRIGKGGPQLDFETLNGDIRIKRKQ
jgi:hypothetical protein